MDYIFSFFESDQAGDLISLSAIQSQEQQIVPEAEGLSRYSENGTVRTNQVKHMQRRKCKALSAREENPHGCQKKKIDRRENERQRRQEMAALYGSLRSILPFEYLKGKRSASDHIQEAAKYIRHLEKKIQELNIKRDEIKKLSNWSSTGCADDQIFESDERVSFTVKPCLLGVEVVIDTSLRKGLLLSAVLQVLIEENLNIISCDSTKVKERMFHIIKSEARDGKSIGVSALEQKLLNSIIRRVN